MLTSGFVLGFHGCDEAVGERILAGRAHVSISENAHDWLGNGAYFWEHSPQRALKWAELVQRHPQHFRHRIEKPFILGAIIEPGNSLNLSELESLASLRAAHQLLRGVHTDSGAPMPVNEPGFTGDLDLVRRHLDCAVINFAHILRERGNLPPYDTVRGSFPEGGPLYTGARIMENTHVQICVRHPRRSIRGYFRPLLRES